jgi:cytochrome P450
MLLVGLVLFCVFAVLLAGAVVLYRFCYFSLRSIASPPVRSLVFGHLFDLWSVHSYSEQLRQWTSQYGPVYGLFEGIRPVYVVSDISFIEQVFVQQFHRFPRRRSTLTNRLLGRAHSNVFSADVHQQWKTQRTILNPTFSAAKMKRLLPSVEQCVDLFVERLDSVGCRTTINIYEMYKRLTMDVICQ